MLFVKSILSPKLAIPELSNLKLRIPQRLFQCKFSVDCFNKAIFSEVYLLFENGHSARVLFFSGVAYKPICCNKRFMKCLQSKDYSNDMAVTTDYQQKIRFAGKILLSIFPEKLICSFFPVSVSTDTLLLQKISTELSQVVHELHSLVRRTDKTCNLHACKQPKFLQIVENSDI